MSIRRGDPLARAGIVLAGLVVAGATTLLLPSPSVAATNQPACPATPPVGAKLPDLINMIPHHLDVHEAQQRSTLRFTVGLVNAGAGPLELVPSQDLTDPTQQVDASQYLYDSATNTGSVVCARSLGDAFSYHESHNHWHLSGVNGFEVRTALDDGSGGVWSTAGTVGEVLKESFCLIDYVPMSDDQLAAFGLTRKPREYWDCAGTHGISSGWIDYYHHSTHGQTVDITGAPAGVYYFVLTANPDGHFIEDDYSNNRAWVSFRLRYNNQNNAVVDVLYNSVDQAGEGIMPPNNTNK